MSWLPAGVYELRLVVAGFEPVRQKIQMGARPLRTNVRLKLARRLEEVTVAEGGRTVAAEAGRNADTISVEREMLDNLPVLDLNYLSALGAFSDHPAAPAPR